MFELFRLSRTGKYKTAYQTRQNPWKEFSISAVQESILSGRRSGVVAQERAPVVE